MVCTQIKRKYGLLITIRLLLAGNRHMQPISWQFSACIIIKLTTSAVRGLLISKKWLWCSLLFPSVDQWFLVMSTQLIGFSIGGIAKRFLVSPPTMIWPTNLVNCALFNTLHSQQYAGIGTRGGISRERFFVYCFLGSFAWCTSPW